jgi:DNA-binding beta-propeller fold protein YncE
MCHRTLLCIALISLASGCTPPADQIGRFQYAWGRQGNSDGRFQTPRGIAIDGDDTIYVVDKTARIQVFNTKGEFLRQWTTPQFSAGKPEGISAGRNGKILVADTHYYRALVYSNTGQLLLTIGGTKGGKPGEFNLVAGVAEDSGGNLYVSEYGEYDRIQKFDASGKFLLQFGGHGSEPGEFIHPQKLVFDEKEQLWVADAGNHRVQIFDTSGKRLGGWGKQGSGLGELYYPYDLVFAPGDVLYICEYGNHRVQKFTREGKSLGSLGHEGRREGELYSPWGIVRDKAGRIYVTDSCNHRVQKAY